MKRPRAILLGVLTLAGAQAYANLVQNPGFETGGFTGWTIGSPVSFKGGVNTTDPNSGTYSAKLEANPGSATLSQTILVTPGDVYDVSFWLATPFYDGFNALSVSFGGVLLLSVAYTGAAYNEYTFTDVAAGTGVISFGITASAGYYQLDDISVTDVTPAGVPDAASTAGLLGLGLAGLLALRRRLGRQAGAGESFVSP